jgi:hypothetical protein
VFLFNSGAAAPAGRSLRLIRGSAGTPRPAFWHKVERNYYIITGMTQKTMSRKNSSLRRRQGVTGSDVTPLKIVLVLVLVLGNSRKERTRTKKRTRTMAEELASLPVAPAQTWDLSASEGMIPVSELSFA